MNVTINDKPFEVKSNTTLHELLIVNSIKTQGIATAVNGNVIPASERDSTILNEGDSIVIIKVFYGG